MTATSLTVFLAALVTALATGLGALPFLFTPDMSRRGLGISNALAAGLMIAASLMLFYEGHQRDLPLVGLGALLGGLFVALSRRWLAGRQHLRVGDWRGADARKALLIVGVMTIHSFTEGVGVGVAYGGDATLGAFITTAIAVHNIPEGLAISLVLVPQGAKLWQAALWSIFSSLPQPLMAVPAFLFVEAFAPLLPLGLGFAGGAMIWMSFGELLPDALEEAPREVVAAATAVGMAAMLWFQWWISG